jgi:ribosome biogenesis protein Nip4
MGHVARIVKMKNAYNMLVGSSEGKRPLEKPKHRWEDNIRKDLREIVWEGVDWIHLAQDRDRWWALVNAVMVLRGSMKGREFLD